MCVRMLGIFYALARTCVHKMAYPCHKIAYILVVGSSATDAVSIMLFYTRDVLIYVHNYRPLCANIFLCYFITFCMLFYVHNCNEICVCIFQYRFIPFYMLFYVHIILCWNICHFMYRVCYFMYMVKHNNHNSCHFLSFATTACYFIATYAVLCT